MAVANKNKLMIDRPMWEQLAFAPATGVAGTSVTDDGERFIYAMFATSATAAAFWRYDTWYDSWQQLATPATQTITIGKLMYTPHVGSQFSGKCYGSVYSFQSNGTTCYWYRYDIATNTWASALSTTNVPAAFGTDAYINYPQPVNNNWQGGYHSGVTMTVTTSSTAATGATSVAVTSLPAALAANTVLDFGVLNITLSANAAKGATSVSCNATSLAIAAGTILTGPDGHPVYLSTAAAAGATTLTVYPLKKALNSGDIITVRKKAALTASAAAAATSITVSALNVALGSGDTAIHYDNMYLIGNNSTQIYRYNIAANAWTTTSANSGNPAFPALSGAAGAGCGLKWLPAYVPDKLWCIRGGATANVYMYDLVANTVSNETFYPSTETFTTGTWHSARSINGKNSSLVIQKDATMRFYEGTPPENALVTRGTQWLYPTGSAVVGDRSCCVTSPDGIEYLYCLLHSSTALVRCQLIDQ